MPNLPSHKKLDCEYLISFNLNPDLQVKYENCRYKIYVPLKLGEKNRPEFSSVTVESIYEGQRKSVVILKKPDPTIENCKIDREHVGKFIFLLAAKLKYDSLRKFEGNITGFLHSDEITKLNQERHTEVPPTIHGGIRRLLRNSKKEESVQDSFLKKFLFEHSQLYHLICRYGKTGTRKGTEDSVWWLNVSPEDIEFRDSNNTERIVPDDILQKHLKKLFPSKYLLSITQIKQFHERHDKEFPNKRESEIKKDKKQIMIIPPDSQIKGFLGKENISAPTKYLNSIRDILKYDSTEEAQWFRKGGPIAVDFQKGVVYERKELLHKIEELVSNNKISILEGYGGTGKSVLIRNFAYKLIEKNKSQAIYHYSFKTDPPIADFHDFLHILKSINGIVIIEDIHLATPDMQYIVNNFPNDCACRMLLTARPSFRNNMIEQRSTTLKEIPSLKLEIDSHADISSLIKFYGKNHVEKEFKWNNKIEGSLEKISEGNLWLLSYALKGCTGKGDAVEWLKKGVQQDLRDLENLRGYDCNPVILLAISPLSMNEVLTAQSFLIKTLKFSRKDINKLVSIGEVLKHEIEGTIFYSLPHSSLGLAYWEYGNEYRDSLDFADYNDFIYNYTTANVPNGLTAYLSSMPESSVAKLNASQYFIDIFNKEQSIEAVRKWLYVLESSDVLSEDIIDIIASKISNSNDVLTSVFCLLRILELDKELSKVILSKIDWEVYSNKLNTHPNAFCVANAIEMISRYFGGNIIKQITKNFDVKNLSTNVQSLEFDNALIVLWLLLDSVYEIGYKLWNLLSSYFAQKMKEEKINKTVGSIKNILRYSREIGRALLKYKGEMSIVQELNDATGIWNSVGPIMEIAECDKIKASEIYKKLNLELLYKKTQDSIDSITLILILNELYLINPQVTLKLICLIKIQVIEEAIIKRKSRYLMKDNKKIDVFELISKWEKEIKILGAKGKTA